MKVHTFLPKFEGFYNSLIDNMIEDHIGMEIEYLQEEKSINDIEYSDFEVDFQKLSKDIHNNIAEYIKETLPSLKLDFEFERLVSPMYYNYATDSVDTTIELDKEELIKLMHYYKDRVEQFLEENYKDSPGFTSFHSIYFEDWVEIIRTEDYTEGLEHKIGAIIEALIDIVDEDFTLLDVYNDLDLFEYITLTK